MLETAKHSLLLTYHPACVSPPAKRHLSHGASLLLCMHFVRSRRHLAHAKLVKYESACYPALWGRDKLPSAGYSGSPFFQCLRRLSCRLIQYLVKLVVILFLIHGPFGHITDLKQLGIWPFVRELLPMLSTALPNRRDLPIERGNRRQYTLGWERYSSLS